MNNKGFTLVEMLLTLLIISILSVLVTSFLSYGYETFNVQTGYAGQQHKIQQALTLLGRDLRACRKIEYTTKAGFGTMIQAMELEIPAVSGLGDARRTWELTGGALQCTVYEGASSSTAVSVEGIDTTNSAISLVTYSSNSAIVVSIVPEPTNKGKYQGNNIREPIITEYSVKYKEVTP